MVFRVSAEFPKWKTVSEREDMRKTNDVELFVYLFVSKQKNANPAKPMCNFFECGVFLNFFFNFHHLISGCRK